MKKLLLSAIVIGFGILLLSCKEDSYTSQQILEINSGAEFLSLNSESHIGKLDVDAAAAWNLTSDADWLAISPTSGKNGSTEITIDMQANSSEARYAILKFTTDQGDIEFVVSQSANSKLSNFQSPTHYFYVTFGTLPTLYAGIYMLSNKKPSYVFYERTKTFDASFFPPYATYSPYYTQDQTKLRDYMKQQIRDINQNNPTAVFGLMVDDLRARIGYDWFVGQGIDSSRVKVTLLSDGTATYQNFYNKFNDESVATENWDKIASEIDALDWDHNGQFPSSRAIGEFESYDWAYSLVTRPNYRLLLQDANLLETQSTYIKDQMEEMDLYSAAPYDLLKNLPQSDRNRFFQMAQFDFNKFNEMFDTQKPNLVIVGTNKLPAEQLEYTQQIYNQYQATHDIFFKPHPTDTSSADYETTFPGLTLLPGQMPFEIFVWSLIDKIDIIGGFSSTVFLTVPLEKVKFIFAPNAESLIRPLNLLFKNVPPDFEWIQ